MRLDGHRANKNTAASKRSRRSAEQSTLLLIAAASNNDVERRSRQSRTTTPNDDGKDLSQHTIYAYLSPFSRGQQRRRAMCVCVCRAFEHKQTTRRTFGGQEEVFGVPARHNCNNCRRLARRLIKTLSLWSHNLPTHSSHSSHSSHSALFTLLSSLFTLFDAFLLRSQYVLTFSFAAHVIRLIKAHNFSANSSIFRRCSTGECGSGTSSRSAATAAEQVD